MERIGEPDRADEFDDMSVDEYAEHRGLELVSNPNTKARKKTMAAGTKAELSDAVDEAVGVLNEAYTPGATREELASAVGEALDILNGDDADEDDESDSDEDEDEGGIAARQCAEDGASFGVSKHSGRECVVGWTVTGRPALQALCCIAMEWLRTSRSGAIFIPICSIKPVGIKHSGKLNPRCGSRESIAEKCSIYAADRADIPRRSQKKDLE